VEEDKGKVIAFELKTRVEKPVAATSYKKYLRKFEEGSLQGWIDMVKDLEEIWMKNYMTEGISKASTVRVFVKGESAVAFETTLQDSKIIEEGEMISIILENINKALETVTHAVFPYYALKTQCLWINRKMLKLSKLTNR
jgi:hypothetical protein